MLNVLIRLQLRALAASLFARGRRKAAGPLRTLGFALLMLYCIGAVAMLFGVYFAQLAAPCHAAGLGWLYFAMTALSSLTLMVIGGVFMTKSLLYEARDNQLLLAMPIPPIAILGSRLAVLWLYDLVFGLVVALPAGAVWVWEAGATVLGAAAFVLIFLALPLLAVALSGLLGWLLALLSARVRNKTLFSTLFGVAFLLAYFVGYSRIFQYVQQLAARVQQVAGSLSAAAPLVWLGRAIAGPSLGALLATLACILVPFGLMAWLLAATFLKTATAQRGAARVEYREKAERQRPVEAALLGKELRRFFSSSAYILNAGLGVVFLLALTVLAPIKAGTLRQVLAALPARYAQLAGPVLALALCGLQSTVLISAPSVSLEGRGLWQMQSLPVTPQQCLWAKVWLHLTLAVPPTLLAGPVLGAVLQLPVLQTGLATLCGGLFCCWCAMLGVVMNLFFPRFDWVNEMVAVKQGPSVLLAMLGSFAALLVLALPYLLWLTPYLPPTAYLACLTAVLLALCAGFARWLDSAGARRFAAL